VTGGLGRKQLTIDARPSILISPDTGRCETLYGPGLDASAEHLIDRADREVVRHQVREYDMPARRPLHRWRLPSQPGTRKGGGMNYLNMPVVLFAGRVDSPVGLEPEWTGTLGEFLATEYAGGRLDEFQDQLMEWGFNRLSGAKRGTTVGHWQACIEWEPHGMNSTAPVEIWEPPESLDDAILAQ
jgi:hypothetical protein